MKKKIKVNYTKFPTFEKFVNKKSIEDFYDCCGSLLKRKIYINDYKIIVLCEALVDVGWEKYAYKQTARKEFPLTTSGYLEMQMYIHRNEFGEKCALEQVTVDVIHETYKLFDEYKEKLIALEVEDD